MVIFLFVSLILAYNWAALEGGWQSGKGFGQFSLNALSLFLNLSKEIIKQSYSALLVALKFCNGANQETIIPEKYRSLWILKSTKEHISMELKTQLAEYSGCF